MSDQSQGPGWWVASDGKWYPPQPEPAAPIDPNAPTWDGTQWVYPATAVSEAVASHASVESAAEPVPATDPNAPTWDGTQWVYPAAAARPPEPAPPSPPAQSAASPAANPAAMPYTMPAAIPLANEPGGGSAKTKLLAVVAVVAVMLVLGIGVAYVITTRNSGTTTAGDVTTNAVVSGPDELPSKDLTLGDKAVVVRGNGGATLKSVASDGSTFTLDGGVEGVDKLSAGSVLLLTGVTVVKISSVEKSGSDVVVKTEPAAITDVIKDGTLKWESLKTGPGTLSVWDPRPEDLEVDDNSDGGGSTDTTDTTGKVTPGMLDPGWLVSHPSGAIPGVAGAYSQADSITKEGKVGDFSYSYNQTGGLDGSSTYKISITKEGNLLIKLDLDASVDPIISSGDLHVAASTLDTLHLKTDKFNGKAKVHIEAGTGESIAPVKQEILSLPIEVKYPIVIYGIPFYLGIKGKFLIEPAFTSKNSTIQAQGEVSFGGSAGLTWEGGSLSAEGALVTKREDPLQYIDGLGVGVTGMVFAAQFPRVSFGLGYGSSTAGVYLASTTSIGATVASSIGMLPCRQVTVTETVSAGADAKFIGIELPLGQKATAEITKKTWTFYAPKSEACKIEGAEP